LSGPPARVLHVITRLDLGGSAENTLLTVAGLHRERYEAVLAVGVTRGERSPTEAVARDRGIEFVDVPHLVRAIRPWHDVAAAFDLWRLCRRGGFDIVHTHTSKAGLLGRAAARLAGVPAIVHTPHGHVFYGYYGPVVTHLFVWLERLAARWCDCIIALTEEDAADHVRFGVAPRSRFRVIHSGVDFTGLDDNEDTPAGARAALGLPDQGLVIGTLGRLTAVKGQADLIEACAALRARGRDVCVALFGEGEERQALEALARERGMAEHVHMPGWQRGIGRALRSLDVFALPSHNEGMGKALVEAMYMGLPCVASDVGGVPELIASGENGLLVPPRRPGELAAALDQLAACGGLRQRLGEAAQRRARAYGADAMVDKIEALYGELTALKGAGV